MCMFMRLMWVLVRMMRLMLVIMRVMLVRVVLVGVVLIRVFVMIVFLLMLVAMRIVIVMRVIGVFRRNHVDLGRGDSTTHDFTRFKARAHVQRGRRFSQHVKGDAGVDQRAQQHVAADARETLKVTNTHRVVIVNCRRKRREKRVDLRFTRSSAAADETWGTRNYRHDYKSSSRKDQAPRRARTSRGRIAFMEPERKPVVSSVTYWKPACLRAAVI